MGNSEAVSNPSEVEDLVGLSDIATRFGISRQLALTWARREDFPAPVGRVSAGRVWRLEDVLTWAKGWEPARRRLS